MTLETFLRNVMLYSLLFLHALKKEVPHLVYDNIPLETRKEQMKKVPERSRKGFAGVIYI